MAIADISKRMLRPLTECFTPEVAQQALHAKLDADMQAQIDDFALKANLGTLTDDEQAEYATIVEYIDFIGIIKANTRSLLGRQASERFQKP